MSKDVYKTITQATRKLLDADESENHDFKETLASVKPEDFVAFANRSGGGNLLIGVREPDKEKGTKAEIVGCAVGDQAKVSLYEKAQSCRPPIRIQINVENSNKTPFLRIIIPNSDHKPHCTEKGVYKLRQGPKNAVLVPEHLLEIFLETQKRAFVQNFSEASKELSDELEQIKITVDSVMGFVSHELIELQEQLEKQLSEVSGLAENTSFFAEDAGENARESVASLQELEGKVDALEENAFNQSLMLDQITEHLGLEPISKLRARRTLIQIMLLTLAFEVDPSDMKELRELLDKNPTVRGVASLFSDEELEAIYEHAKAMRE